MTTTAPSKQPSPLHGQRDGGGLVTWWLALCTLLVLLMIVVGGYTRLSQSGLSMVDWQPVAGVLPPMTEQAWQAEFNRYKAFPEYQHVNAGMSLAGFKRIYLVEYAHRILGRVIGLVFFIPFIVLWLLGRVQRGLSVRLMLVFILGGLQGFLGWYMVKSGLVDQPHVSQYRLTAHLSLAVALFGYLFWLTLKTSRGNGAGNALVVSLPSRIASVFVALTALMIVTGGFMAGTHAGYIHNTFPMISGAWVPTGLFSIEPAWRNLFENATTIQFVHRYLAFITFAMGVSLTVSIICTPRPHWHRAAWITLLVLAAQVSLGIITLVLRVPLPSALMHQLGAMCLLAAGIYLTYRTRIL